MIELINDPAKLYRIGRRDGLAGSLWYDDEGRETGLIHSMPGAAAGALPMGPDPVFRTDGVKWISCTDSEEMLLNWFSVADAAELMRRGYVLQEISVRNYRRFHFPQFSHEVFCEEQVIGRRVMKFEEVFDVRMAA